MAQNKWRSQYFVNISPNFYCPVLNFLLKDAPFHSLQNCTKINLSMNSREIVSGQHCYALKRPTFKCAFFRFHNLRRSLTRCKNNWIRPFVAYGKLDQIRKFFFRHTMNVYEKNLIFIPPDSCFKDLRVRLNGNFL